MPILAKGLTLLILWGVLVVGLTRTFAARKSALTAGSVLGLITGTVAGFLLFNSFTGELPFAIIKSLVAVAFISLFIVAAFAWHKAPAPAITEFSPSLSDHPAVTAMAAFLSATVFAILAVCRLSNSGDNAQCLQYASFFRQWWNSGWWFTGWSPSCHRSSKCPGEGYPFWPSPCSCLSLPFPPGSTFFRPSA
ncbi:hypothetical protein [Geotalea toluenoxydans]|uniref:hypothetical protein n=1 Tax=Geotalea toluenoxydans TaxID=421624 RepID=UPI0006D17BB8|nr:hypothetical protein [Geotalea toluenoxydans]